MARKVTLAIFDNDLRVKLNKYELSENGTKIKVKSGGDAHWMPSFDNDSFIEFPYRSLFSPWKTSWRRVYFVKKRGSKCVNFKAEPTTVSGPDPEQMKEAIGATLLKELGKDDNTVTWISWATLAVSVLVLLVVSGVLR